MKKFSIILATDQNNGIGMYLDGKYSIPWKSQTDMDFFKKVTTTCPEDKKNVVIMGRNTFQSIGRKLPKRINIILTSNQQILDDLITFGTLNTALEYCSNIDNIHNIFIIGGARLYEEAFSHPRLEKIYWNKLNIQHSKANIFVKNPQLDNFILDEDFIKNDIRFMKYINKGNHCESEYLSLLQDILENGDERKTRNSITKSLFGKKLEFNLKNKFPLLTTKKMFLRGIFEELLWFLRGKTDSKYLENKKVNIWKGNTTEEFIRSRNLPYREGDIGNMYGFQLKHSGCEYKGCDAHYTGKGFDQLEYCLNLLKTDKYSRRIIMTTFTPDKADMGVLYPCHGIVIQFYVKESNSKNYLSCHMYQRSGDAFLGIPFNITSYSLMTYIICEIINNDIEYNGLKYYPDNLIISFGDVHIYEDHYEQVKQQIEREPYNFPKIKFNKSIKSFEDINWENLILTEYNSHPKIKAEMIA